jgi:Tol biopolymer transport system component
MRPYRLMLVCLALGLAFANGCGVGNDSGGPHGGGGTPATSTTAANFGIVGNAYFSSLSIKSLTAPVTWTVFGGVPLPDGLALTSATGAVTGTPTAAGNTTVTFTATDSTGNIEEGTVLFAIHPKTDRVSANSSGTEGNGINSTPSMSGDGSLVTFVSQSTNFVTSVSGTQIYVHNRDNNEIEVISRDSNADAVIEGDGVSSAPAITADGRFVAFVSQSTNLVTGVSGQQVYLRDRQTGLTTVASKDTLGAIGNGVSSVPAISADGRYIAFVSLATNLVTGVTGQQIYLHDRQTGQTTLVSKDNSPTPIQGNGVSHRPAISSDGRYIAFASVATNFAAGVGGNQEIYLHDRFGVNGTTSLISKDNNATPGNGNSSTPSISGNGRFVAFTSLATNLVTGVTGQQIYLHDRFAGGNGTNVLISHDNSGAPIQGNGNSSAPSISSDGQFVAFTSLATNLLAPASAVAGPQIYIHDWLTGANGVTSLVSKDNSVTPVAGISASATDTPSINSEGGFVAFSSQATNLVAGSGSHIYVRALP